MVARSKKIKRPHGNPALTISKTNQNNKKCFQIFFSFLSRCWLVFSLFCIFYYSNIIILLHPICTHTSLSLFHSHTSYSRILTHTHTHIQLPVIQSHTLSFLSNLACACLNVPGAISLWLSAWLKRHLRKSLLQMFPKCWLGFR